MQLSDDVEANVVCRARVGGMGLQSRACGVDATATHMPTWMRETTVGGCHVEISADE